MKVDITNITKDEILGLTSTERKEIVKEGVLVYIQQVELSALLLEIDFLSLLENNIDRTEKEIKRLTEDEEYELCYFLQEVLNKVKEKYNGL